MGIFLRQVLRRVFRAPLSAACANYLSKLSRAVSGERPPQGIETLRGQDDLWGRQKRDGRGTNSGLRLQGMIFQASQ